MKTGKGLRAVRAADRMRAVIAAAVLALAAVFCICAAVSVPFTVAEKTQADVVAEFDAEYAVGTAVRVPDLQIEQGGVKLETSKRTIGPDGTVYTDDVVEIVHQGVYTVEYTASGAGGEILTETHTFSGYYPLYGTGKKNSSAYYGASSKYGGISGRDGIVVSLTSGDSFVWNEVIDLSGHTPSDHIVELYVTPNTLGTADARNLCFVLTDIYDPNNYVTVMAKKVTAVDVGAAWAEQQTFVTAGANGQLQMGLRKDDADKDFVIYEGERYGREIGNKMGSTVPGFSLPGVPKYVQNDASSISEENFLNNPQTFTFSFDAEKNVIYAGNGKTDYIVADLDAEECFESLWGGFTTGEVYLSIKGTEYLSSSLNFVITKIDGEDVGIKAAGGNKIIDKEAPSLTVDVPETVPEAVVDVPYKLFPATANDVYDGEIVPAVTVVSGGEQIEVKDGAFVPASAASYLLTYTATDYSGNSVSQTVSVTARKGRVLSLSLDEAEPAQNLTGKQVGVAGYSAENVSGTLQVDITATRIADAQGNAVTDGVRYAVTDGAFCPMYDGRYRIDYLARDYLVEVSRSYEISVDNNPAVVMIDDAALPRYFISGMVYETPQMTGYWFDESGPHEIAAAVSWSGDGDAEFTQAKGLFTPVAEDRVTVRFTAAYGERQSAVKTYEVPAVDVGYNDAQLHIDKYFAVSSGNAVISAESDRISLQTDADTSVAFANTLQAANFEFRFAVGSIGRFGISLTAVSDPYKRLEVRYEDLGTGKMQVTVFVPGDSYANTFSYNAGDQITLKYYDAARVLYLTEKLSVDISKMFAGFDDSVWLDVTFEEAGTADFYELNGQILTNIAADWIKPMIVVDVETGDRMLNDIYYVEKCTIADVLDTYVIAYMYMTTPTGAYATATDGTILNSSADYGRSYEVLLDMYGVYTVYYYAKDTAGNVQTFTFQVTVADSFAPEIITEEKDRFVKLGGEIVPAPYEVKDDLTPSDQITSYVSIIRPDGSAVSGTEPLQATMKGVYKIIYYAFDAYGNMCTQSFEITVY